MFSGFFDICLNSWKYFLFVWLDFLDCFSNFHAFRKIKYFERKISNIKVITFRKITLYLERENIFQTEKFYTVFCNFFIRNFFREIFPEIFLADKFIYEKISSRKTFLWKISSRKTVSRKYLLVKIFFLKIYS